MLDDVAICDKIVASRRLDARTLAYHSHSGLNITQPLGWGPS